MSDNTNLEQGALPLFKEKPNEAAANAALEEEAKHPGEGGANASFIASGDVLVSPAKPTKPALRVLKAAKGSIDPIKGAIASTFAVNKDVELLYFTSNGWAFFTEDKAKEAAAGLPDKKVTKVFNPRQLAAANAALEEEVKYSGKAQQNPQLRAAEGNVKKK